MTLPRATARLQLHGGFTLEDAARQAGYYAALGVSHLYLSPITRARPGSTHGYDVVDHAVVNPELGGEDALAALAAEARRHGLGLILDIVPNHMATHAENAWWWEVLCDGAASVHARTFDIDWQPADPALHGKVLLPVLGEQYGACLAEGSIALTHDPQRGGYCIAAHGTPYPLAAGTLPQADSVAATLALYAPGAPGMPERLHALLQVQHYRLAWWRTAPDQINWRRFFEITDLIGVRVDEPRVFDAVHALVLRLYAQGVIDGVRIDHIDGLAEPGAYCRRLRQALARARVDAGQAPGEPYIVVEKILAEGESLPLDWGVDGTTGYDFMDQVAALLHHPAAQAPLEAFWREISGDARDPAAQLRAARQRMVQRHFPAERAALVRCLLALARRSPDTRDWSAVALDRALSAILVNFPVYRTYAGEAGRSHADLTVCRHAWEAARLQLGLREDDPEAGVLAFLDRHLGGAPIGSADAMNQAGDAASSDATNDAADAALPRETLRRFQQLTPPLAAKALEDTLFYRYGPMLSRNEVGSAPGSLALAPEAFLARAQARARDFPYAMLATATHDHKRGEDVRARLAVLTEHPQAWLATLRGWLAREPAASPRPDAVDRCMLLQTVVGAWPVGLEPEDRTGVQAFFDRVSAWQLKALREAKRRSSWASPDARYEAACEAELRGLQDDPEWLAELARQAQAVMAPGMVNGLAQTLLRQTLPGVPDLYQGREFWDFSLVDPDNRLEVDYAARFQALARLAEDGSARGPDAWLDGSVKQALIRRCLRHRGEHPDLYAHGVLHPLAVLGPRAGQLFAFLRSHASGHLLVVVPRLCASALGFYAHEADPGLQAQAYWNGTEIMLPGPAAGVQAENVLGAAPAGMPPSAGRIGAGLLLRDFPVAAWHLTATA